MSINESNSNKAKRQRLDLPVLTGAEERVVLIQYKKDNNIADDNDVSAILVEYLKFMHIKIIGEQQDDDDGECCAPSKKIDAMWHAHILSTRQYVSFCERYNGGEYIHHDPSMLHGQRRYELTLRRYREVLGHDPKDRKIWPLKIEAPIVHRENSDGEDDENKHSGDSDDEEADDDDEEVADVDNDGEDSDDDDEDEDSDDYSFSSQESWYKDERHKGTTRKERKKWHKDFALRHGDDNLECWTNSHSWIKGEYDHGCEDCRYRSHCIEEWYNDGKGNDYEEREEYHKRYALRHEDREMMGPKHGDPHGYCGCLGGHKWRDGEYDVYCPECRMASSEIDAFTCG